MNRDTGSTGPPTMHPKLVTVNVVRVTPHIGRASKALSGSQGSLI